MEVLRTVNHLFLWAIYTMAMSNNQRVVNNIVYGRETYMEYGHAIHAKNGEQL